MEFADSGSNIAFSRFLPIGSCHQTAVQKLGIALRVADCVLLFVPEGREMKIKYEESEVEVTPEVAKLLKKSDQEKRNQKRKDERNRLSFVGLTSPEPGWDRSDPVFDEVSRRIELQQLHKALDALPYDDWWLVIMYYFLDLSMTQIGTGRGVSKMAICKRLKRILNEMRELMET